MGRRAVWRARPDDPRTTLGWMRRVEWGGTLSGKTALLYTVVLGIFAFTSNIWVLLALPAVAMNLGLPARRRADLTSLVTFPPPGPAFQCRLSIERGSANSVIGCDEGVVTFVDGWLHFAGLRTEFSFRAVDVKGFGDPSKGPRFLLPDVTIELRPLDSDLADDLLRAARYWYNSLAEGDEPIFPPQTVHGSGFARTWVLAVRSFANVLASTTLITSLLLLATGHGFYAFTIPFFAGGGDTLRHLKALREFQKEERRQKLTNLSKPAIGP